VLAVALVTTLLVVCLLQHTPLALVTPEVIIIIILILTSCGVRVRVRAPLALLVLCVALCLLRLDRSSLGVHQPTHSPTIGISTLKETLLGAIRQNPGDLYTSSVAIGGGGKGEISTMRGETDPRR